MANRVLSQVKALYNWAIAEDIVPVSPAARLKPAPETLGDRVLDDFELGQVWRACQLLDSAADWEGAAVRRKHGDIVRLLMLTGQRLNEVAGMAWDFTAKTWTLPRERCKNGHAHVTPLSEPALAILAAKRAREEEGPLVFGVKGFSRAKKELDAAARLDAPWCLHDLRRTAASGMARHGIPPHVVEAVLNHKSGTVKGVAAVYNRYSYASEKREALRVWAEHVAQCGRNIIIARAA